MDEVCTMVSANSALTEASSPFETVADQEENVGHAPGFQLGRHCQYLTRSHPRLAHIFGNVTMPGQIGPDRDANRVRTDLAIADLTCRASMNTAAWTPFQRGACQAGISSTPGR
jgi:hypothetical protein